MLNNLLFRLFPPTCLLCGAPGDEGQDLCAGCRADLPVNDRPCRRCALPLPATVSLICGQCQQEPPAFDRIIAPFLYQPPMDYLIKALKFQGRLAFARLLGGLLGRIIAERGEPQPECLLPVPLHPSRLRERGFNQALEIARSAARPAGLMVRSDSLRRIRATTPQTQLAGEARRHNVRGAFAVYRPITARHVAIVDDVVTTGSTINELARLLRTAGVAEIEVWACARTPPRG